MHKNFYLGCFLWNMTSIFFVFNWPFSAVPSPPTLRAKLDTLECHFTWNLNSHRNNVLRLRDILEDIGTVDGNRWQGHIYNLQAHVHFLLASGGKETPGSTMSDALRCFGQATEAFRQVRNTVAEEGPWLLVNYANLAWLHYHRGEWSESLAYVGKAEALLREDPSPVPGQPHQEVLAEKAWTLMNFGQDGKRRAVELFSKAIELEPAGPVEWTTSHALALAASSPPDSSPEQKAVLETLQRAVEDDPDNLYVAAIYLGRLAMIDSRGIAGRARELAKRVLERPQSSYSGIRPLLRVYRQHVSLDEGIDVANEALERHPTKRHIKYGLANMYKWKIFSDGDSPLIEGMRIRAIGLYEELCSLYPHSFLIGRITLANLYDQSSNHGPMEGDKLFKELLEIDLEPAYLQILYNKYAKFLNFSLQDRQGSIEYHMKAAAILHSSPCQRNSIHILTQIKNRRMNRMCGEIEDFLAQLTL